MKMINTVLERFDPNADYALQIIDSTGGVDLNTFSGNAIPWETQSFVDNKFTHSTTTNPSRVTFTQDGKYKLTYDINWEGSSSLVVRSFAFLNGLTRILSSESYGLCHNPTDDTGANTNTFFFDVTDGDYIEIIGERSAGNGSADTIANESHLLIEYIR